MSIKTDYITEKDLSVYLTNECGLPTSKKLLEKLRAQGKSPAFRKWGRTTVYARNDVDEWVSNKMAHLYKYTMSNYAK